ncbi:MAG: catechol 2,3-dioxygenase-like lactoylglutathione lyase family enzyme [Gammaproteobacteria bacterium]|jgi:catechol 2,3-dioxygenase-like lactoylglutathione lyase family enzyme
MNEALMDEYERKRDRLRETYIANDAPGQIPGQTSQDSPVATGGVDHLALICSDLDATITFYIDILKMRLVKVISNRDEPTSTHIFLDMGGGNMLAFFDFPNHGPARTVRGVGSMHHVALKASPEKYQDIVQTLKTRGIAHSIHGSDQKGSVYMRDPDNIHVEVTTGYGF